MIVAVTATAAVLLDLLPLPDSAPRAVAPSLLVCVFYFWTVSRPETLSPAVVFALGLVLDAAGGMPLAVTSLALLLARGMLLLARRRLLGQPLVVLWASFLPAALMVAGLRWMLASLAIGRPLPLEPMLRESAVTFVAYPVVAGLLARLQRRSMARSRAAGG
jgi:rod shape-determining protein MreD